MDGRGRDRIWNSQGIRIRVQLRIAYIDDGMDATVLVLYCKLNFLLQPHPIKTGEGLRRVVG
jgi:hypothetical protein